MDTKKPVALPDQFLSVRKKVVPGLGLWVGASFIIISVLFLSSSLNGRVVSPLAFQGFNNVGANSSSRVSWPFSLASSHRSNFSHSVSSNGSSSDMHSLGVILEKTQMENLVEKDKNGSSSDGSVDFPNFSGESGEINGFGRTHLGNSSDGMSNGSLHVEDGTVAGNFSLSGNGDVHASRSTGGKSLDNYSGVNSSSIVNGSEGYSPNATVEVGGVADGGNGGEDDEIQNKRERSLEDCDIYDGGWVRDDSKPLYPPGSCPHIDRDFNCHLNGRPDDGFVKWKWQPNGCDIPRMNATDFLERLRGKKMVFVGDSLNRNMWESLVCILRHSIRRKKHVYEISGRSEFKKKGFYAFRFEDYNCTVDFVGSPFLVRESSFNTRNITLETLRLDLMDKTTSMYHDADIIVFNTGHWWTHEKTSRGEDYYQEGNHVHQRLKVLEAYRRALLTWAKWVDKNIDSNKTQVIFRGYSVTHFRGGQWNSGGQCLKETDPIFDDKYLGKYPSKMRALQHVLQEMKTPIMYLNISRLTDYRKDAHPSIYRKEYKTPDERIAAERSQDCSHWCLPGVPDTWNELLYASLLKAGRGSWRI